VRSTAASVERPERASDGVAPVVIQDKPGALPVWTDGAERHGSSASAFSESAQRTTSDERRATSDERRATSDERRATSDERRATSDERRAKHSHLLAKRYHDGQSRSRTQRRHSRRAANGRTTAGHRGHHGIRRFFGRSDGRGGDGGPVERSKLRAIVPPEGLPSTTVRSEIRAYPCFDSHASHASPISTTSRSTSSVEVGAQPWIDASPAALGHATGGLASPKSVAGDQNARGSGDLRVSHHPRRRVARPPTATVIALRLSLTVSRALDQRGAPLAGRGSP
jgi:hypothetical protein